MSYYTGTVGEVLYSTKTGGTVSTFAPATEDSLVQGLPPIQIPPAFFSGESGGVGKCLRVRAGGRLTCTANSTSASWTIRFWNSPIYTSSSGIPFVSTSKLLNNGITNAMWFLEADIIFQTILSGSQSTVWCMGEVRSPSGFNADPVSVTIPDNNTNLTSSLFDVSIFNYLYLANTPTTISGSMRLDYIQVYGEN